MTERVIDAVFDSVFIADLTGDIKEVNEACCRTLGYGREALLGMPVSSILQQGEVSEILGLAHEERKRGLRLNLRAAGGALVPVEVNAHRCIHRGKEAVFCAARERAGRTRTEGETCRAVFEELEDGYWETDLAGRLTFVNEAMCRMAEATREELLSGVNLSDYADPETQKRIHETFGEVYRTGRPAAVGDYEVTKRDGSTGVFQFNVSLMRDEKEQPIGFRGITRDVTERRAMERALQESEESYRNVLELAPDSIAIARRKGARYLQVNDAFCLKTGYSAEEVIGKTSRELNLYVDPAVRKRLFDILAREGKIDGIEIRYRTKDGAVLDDLLSARTIRFRGEECFLIVATTITSLRRAQEALRRSEEKYRTILKNMEEGYYEVDRVGRFTFFNDAMCRMLGFSREELTGMDSRRYTAPEAAERIFETFSEVWRTGKPAEDVVQEIIRKDGTRAAHEMSVSLMKDERGTPVGFRGVVRDVTLRKRAEKEIQTHREHLALINQILRHDLTNDLVVMQSALNLYKISREGELLDETTGRIRKSLKLIDRMKQLESFISSHKDLKAYKIRDIVREVAENYPFIEIEIQGKAQVMADDSLISVIDNIVRNAVIHGKADRIAVTIGEEEGMCEVRIADNGSGIADEIKETIFEEGYRYGDTGHTGIGLHIVKKAMEKYGGYVYVEDNEPRGAAFVLMFRAI
ncbi:MAG: PAS domain S-box protein [Deltaproteobacteria bacterium]|nr:PAS domain S-box protein [Deltaproteobacteria bacterium]